MLPLAFGLGGPWDVAIIGVVLLVLFGTSKIGGLGKSLGESIREFKKATKEDEPLPPASPAATTPPVVAGGVKMEEK